MDRAMAAIGRSVQRRRTGVVLTAAAMYSYPTGTAAHTGEPLAPHDLFGVWNTSPLLLGGIAAFAWLYCRGVANCWRRARRGRGVPVWRVGACAIGVLVLATALISPIDALAGALFSAHMVQHLLLVLVAAPLLVAGAGPLLLLWSIPLNWRQSVARWSRTAAARTAAGLLCDPAMVSLLSAVTLWIWHLPPLYEAALRDEVIHGLEHAMLLGTATLLWWVLLQPFGRRRTSHGVGILVAFAAALHGTLLGALIAFSEMVWYRAHDSTTWVWGLSPLEDQRLAGAMMWPAGLFYLGVVLVLLTAWMGAPERGLTERRKRGSATQPYSSSSRDMRSRALAPFR
jgi:cytochrome c oxidase assembly factor CtaG